MSQGMHEFLAEYYGTAPQPTAEEVAHQQQLDFFAKTAAANGIDLSQLNQQQVQYLWDQVFPEQASAQAQPETKQASAPDPKELERTKQAEAEFLQKKEAMAKIAEADFLGRVVAHAMWNESEKIAAAKQAQALQAAQIKQAEEDKDKDDKGGDKSLRDRLMEAAAKKDDKEDDKEEKKASSGVSEFDIKAAQLAVQKVAASNYWNVNEAVDRLNAVLTLGAQESVKVAMAPNVDAALDIRSSELLEQAGYPIQWGE